ncbi:MAG: ATP-dependent sacrificial sulfur transferase LarE, partial [Proteobacteria bacterium]|nr:ATP-dependent sacrificial sulfur transferase LarE [Pseudomonadota bacterium]NIS63486.1 ATP-dependent sacrificial sulfur transferase LarE [Pseudomonadota bacterium]
MTGQKTTHENQKASLPKSLENKHDDLRRIVKEAGSAVLAFSGGVDSTFLLKVCVDLLGEKALAVTARSETYPVRELEEAKKLARLIGAKHVVIVSEELDVPGFSENPPNRCFLCKHELFSKVIQIARDNGIEWVFDASNVDDVGDFRPGRMAARELGVRSPLEEAGLTKEEIRVLSRMLGLPTWNKPAFACLSSRFPYHTQITRPALKQVEEAENVLWKLGMRQFRVRHHDTIARIELGEEEMQKFWENDLRQKIVSQLKPIGYTYVALDLEGYRTGSMNETL